MICSECLWAMTLQEFFAEDEDGRLMDVHRWRCPFCGYSICFIRYIGEEDLTSEIEPAKI